ncbi:MAG: class I SAM-dependent methyltransferase [Verrucomicrobiales bacterium]
MSGEREGDPLRECWEQHDAVFLDHYLVQEVENPTINPQSVLVRALLADALEPDRHTDLIAGELLYAACASTLLLAARENWWDDLANAVASGEAEAERVPAFMRPLVAGDPAPFSLPDLVARLGKALAGGFSDLASPFEDRWRDALATPAGPQRAAALELACGSANDARFFARYGLADRLDFTGIDIAEKNIANARARCPEARFVRGDVAAMPFADAAFRFVIAFDLFEHLAPDVLERALAEAVRVCAPGGDLYLSFFNADWIGAHDIRPVGNYHSNALSLDRLADSLAALGCQSYVIDLPEEWRTQFPGYRHYNPEARIIVARRGD